MEKVNEIGKVNEVEIPETTSNRLIELYRMTGIIEGQIKSICQTILEMKGVKGNYRISDDKKKLIEMKLTEAN